MPVTISEDITGVASINSGQIGGSRNVIINGAMVVSQRNGTTAVTAHAAYPVDRWSISDTVNGTFSAQQVSDTPVGFSSSLKVTITSAQTANTGNLAPIQVIEGYNLADLGWGAAGAKTVTMSFWVRSSLTGTFGGSLRNSGSSRSYPFTYTISVADTWENKAITIAGDTSGTWLTTNGIGVSVRFSLYAVASSLQSAGTWYAGSATGATGQTQLASTNGATFYITGVQFEKGSTATDFEHGIYGNDLALCQRYYQQQFAFNGYASNTTTIQASAPCIISMRATPTLSAGGALTVTDGAANYAQSSLSITGVTGTPNGVSFNAANFSSLTQFRPCMNNGTASSVGSLAYSAEL